MKNIEDKFAFTTKVILYLVPLFGIVGITVPLAIGHSDISLLASYLAVPMVFAPMVYIFYINKEPNTDFATKSVFYALRIIYFVCYSISIIELYLSEFRTYFYYGLVTVMGLSILLKILMFDTSEKVVTVVLFETMTLFLNISFGVTLKYYYYFGLTDVFAHSWFIENLISQGHITDSFAIYKPFPLWHILCVFVYDISGPFLSLHKIMFLINGIIFSFFIVFVYLVSFKLIPDKKIALLSALFSAFYPYSIIYSMYSIPRSVIIVLETILIMLLLDYSNIKKKMLVSILTFSIVLYHTVSVAFILVILVSCSIVYQAYISKRELKFISSTYLIIVFTLSLAYWMYHAQTLFETLVNYIAIPVPNRIVTNIYAFASISELFNNLHYSFILFFLILGALWATKIAEISFRARIFCILSLLFASLSFPGPALLFEKLSVNFNIIRFGQYSIVFIVVSMAFGFFNLYYKSERTKKIILLISFLILIFLSISNEYTASDNPLVERPFFTFYLTEEEMIASNHISIFSNGYVMSDDIIERYLYSSSYKDKGHILEVNNQKMEFLTNDSRDVMLIRNKELEKRPLRLYPSKKGNFETFASRQNLDYYFNDLSLWDGLNNYNRIYNSGGVMAFN